MRTTGKETAGTVSQIVNGKKHNEIQGVLLADDDDSSSLLVKISQNVMECFALK